jgi:hypothetical protein
MSFVIPTLSLPIALFSSYALYLSTQSIRRVMTYEEKAKKAAEWSAKASKDLHKTRTTHATGVLAASLSLASSIFMLSSSTGGKKWVVAVIGANMIVLVASRAHIQNYWQGKAKVPFVGKFNEAIDFQAQIPQLLAGIAGGWTLVEIVYLMELGLGKAK